MLWGLSPSFDFIQVIKNANPGKTYKEEINILLVGASDARHILTTFAKFHEHEQLTGVIVNFYVIDVLLEVIAREMLLLTVALEPTSEMSLKEKVRIWMEIYGNTLLRPSTSKYVVNKSFQLIQMITSSAFLETRMPCIKIHELKYKERDRLEVIFQFWNKSDFNVSFSWDQMLRRSLTTRFDTRLGVFDWDYHMNLKSKIPDSPINEREYKQWRNNGVAYTWLETDYYVPNRTFALGIQQIDAAPASLGYLGDIEIGPFFSFIAQRPDDDPESATFSAPKYRVTDLIQRKLTTLFYEIENRGPCPSELENVTPSGSIMTTIDPLKVQMTAMEHPGGDTLEAYSPVPVDHKVWFLSPNALETCPKKSKFRSKFDAAFVAAGLVKKLDDGFFSMMRDGSIIVVETWKAAFNISKKGPKDFEMEIKKCMEEHGCIEDTASEGFTVIYKKGISEAREA